MVRVVGVADGHGRRQVCHFSESFYVRLLGRMNTNPKGSKYHYSSYLVAIWVPKEHAILVLGPLGNGASAKNVEDAASNTRGARASRTCTLSVTSPLESQTLEFRGPFNLLFL